PCPTSPSQKIRSTMRCVMRSLVKKLGAVAALLAVAGSLVSFDTLAAPKKDFRVAWTIYVGWMPYDYMVQSGILNKWADKYGIKIEVVQVNDYVESINQYTAGKFDACAITNMDALTIPAAGG